MQLVQLGSAQGSERRRSPAAPAPPMAPPMARQRRSPRCVAREKTKKKDLSGQECQRMSKNVTFISNVTLNVTWDVYVNITS